MTGMQEIVNSDTNFLSLAEDVYGIANGIKEVNIRP